MAYELDLFTISLPTATDLSTKQFTAVGLDSSGNAIAPSGAGVECVGVLQSKPKSGEVAPVRVAGITKMLVGTSSVAAGDAIMTDANGQAATATSTNYQIGRALQGGAAGVLIPVLLLHSGIKA